MFFHVVHVFGEKYQMIMLAIGVAFITADAIEALSRPRPKISRVLQTLPLRLSVWLTSFGIFLAFFGNIWVSSVLTVLIAIAIMTGSNLKFRVLGEPLVFSDIAIAAAAFRFPRLYLFAIPNAIKVAILFGAMATSLCVILEFVVDWGVHLLGLIIAAIGVTKLRIGLSSSLMRKPDLSDDVMKHGVPLTLIFYWQRWLATRHEPIDAAGGNVGATADLLIIVQNESFCDPQALAKENEALQGLNTARETAWAWGNLAVNSFGAYTMRAEYSVLCGIEDSALGFRRYDPFQTACDQASLALPARLPDHRSVFLHPYDLRFFRRDEVMQDLGFDEILGAAALPAPRTEKGPYVSDLAVAEKLATTYIDDATPSLVYVVTMENHGPWAEGRVPGQPSGWPGYLYHLRNSDAMLEMLITSIRKSKRNAVLAFFGDHRPSIPNVVEAGAERHTPYVVMRFNNGQYHSGPGQLDLTPAGLHHAILRAASSVVEKPPTLQPSHAPDELFTLLGST